MAEGNGVRDRGPGWRIKNLALVVLSCSFWDTQEWLGGQALIDSELLAGDTKPSELEVKPSELAVWTWV